MHIRTYTTPFIAYRPDDPAGGGRGGNENEQTVPYDRFKQVNDTLAQTRNDLEQVRQQLTDRDRAGLGEADQLRAQIQDLTREREQAVKDRDTARGERKKSDEALQTLERSAWIRDAAASVKFKDGEKDLTGQFYSPADAIALLDLSTITSEEAAQRAVADLAGRSRHLVNIAQPDAPAASSRADMVEQVLSNGQPAAGGGGDRGADTADLTGRDELRTAYTPANDT